MSEPARASGGSTNGNGRTAPPRLASRLVRVVLPRSGRRVYLGDLDERFDIVAARKGPVAARRWYWRQAIGFVVRVPLARVLDVLQRNRRSRITSALAAFGRDLRYAARTLSSRPGFAMPAVLILMLAVAANSAVLSIVDNVLFRGLPYAETEAIVVVWDRPPADAPSRADSAITYRHYLAWKRQSDLFSEVAAMDTSQPAVRGDDYAIRVHGMRVSGNLFTLLGVSPARGRLLQPDDDVPGADPVVVISDRLWRSQFSADPGILGRVIWIDGVSAAVVGVMPADFWFYDPWMWHRSVGERGTAQPDLWQPLHSRDWASSGLIDYPALRVFARLRDGIDIERARVAAATLRPSLAQQDGRLGFGVGLRALSDQVVGEMRPRLLLLQTAVVLVLLIACVNVMSLVLAKSSGSRTELAVRAAMGASRWALLRLASTEGALLGIVGGGLGLLLAGLLGDLVLHVAPRELPLADRIGIDARIALVTLTMATGAGLLAGLLPAAGIDLGSLTRSLRCGSRALAGSRVGSRTRFALIATEVTLTLVLLIGAVVLVRSFLGLWAADPGFEPDNVLTFDVTLSTPVGEDPDYGFYDRLIDEVGRLPGVEVVGATSQLPFSMVVGGRGVVTRDTLDPEDAPLAEFRRVTDDYFSAMGIAISAGRTFGSGDGLTTDPVVIINEAFTKRFIGAGVSSTGLVGSTVGLVSWGRDPQIVRHRVVGVVENVTHLRMFEDDRPIAYVPFRQEPSMHQRFAVRTQGDPLGLVEPIRRIAAAIDPLQPLAQFNTLESLLAQSMTEERFYAGLVGAFGLMAFVLAAVGVYGSVAYSVRLRLREIGIRLAFGARPAAILRLIVGQGMLPVVVGTVAGAAGAALLTRGLETLLRGVSPLDGPSFVAGSLSFALVAGIAAWLPARRGAQVDPVEVLRAD